MNTQTKRTAGLPDALRVNLQEHLDAFIETSSPEDQAELFDSVISEYCRDIAVALDAEIAVWALLEKDEKGAFQLLLSGPRLVLEEKEEDPEILDDTFHRKMVTSTRQSHGESIVEASEGKRKRMLSAFDVSVTSYMTARFGKNTSLEGVVSIYRFEDAEGNSPFAEKHFDVSEQGRFPFYLSVLDRLIDQCFLTRALERR